jgi:hypothetical protein
MTLHSAIVEACSEGFAVGVKIREKHLDPALKPEL